ncbi:FAD-dependent oxidoreductase [Mesorhizobium sp. WSM3860]|uniref:FAD-dependent oxidoreductase n=1 Tax=Mesorhizobium sp. WSM3860 TaxID=2029403 RepID=UPI0032AF7C50
MERISRALAALNHRVYRDLVPLFADVGLSGHLHRKGALTVYESERGWHAATPGWEAKQRLGIEVRHLSGDQARELEPALGPLVKRAILTPQWSHVSDPKRVVVVCAPGWRPMVRESLRPKSLVSPQVPRAARLPWPTALS